MSQAASLEAGQGGEAAGLVCLPASGPFIEGCTSTAEFVEGEQEEVAQELLLGRPAGIAHKSRGAERAERCAVLC